MIRGEEFIELARHRFAAFVASVGMRQERSLIDATFAELVFANPTRELDLVMDWAEDYRIAARIKKTDSPGHEAPSPRQPEDFTAFDLQTVLARSGLEWDELGKYGPGTRDDVDRAISELIERLEVFGRPLLAGGDHEWRRVQEIAAKRVRDWEAGHVTFSDAD